MPLHVTKHLLHSLLFFIWNCDKDFAQVLGNVVEVEWVDNIRSIQLACASREFREDDRGLIKSFLVVLSINKLKRTKSQPVPQRSIQQNMREAPEGQSFFLGQTLHLINQAAITKFIMDFIYYFCYFGFCELDQLFNFLHLLLFLFLMDCRV